MKLKLSIVFSLIILILSCSENKTTKKETTEPKKEEKVTNPLAVEGKQIFRKKCSYCHHTTQKFTCPSVGGVSDRREDDWIINMIMKPDSMIANDPIAKE